LSDDFSGDSLQLASHLLAPAAAGRPMQDPADQSQFINELLDRQDAVISQLDELLLRGSMRF
jgi:hypothetical protein